jgi:hypothetical protein
MTVQVERAATWMAGSPTKLFAGQFFYNASPGARGEGRTYDVAPDSQRFLMVKDSSKNVSSDVPRPRFVVVENWFEELKRLVPTN